MNFASSDSAAARDKRKDFLAIATRRAYLSAMKYFWLGFGWLCVGLGAIGAFLPLLPTVPFLLLAAFCFARSSERVHQWLLNHPRFGPPIADWRRNGAIRRRVKWLATASILVSFAIPALMGFNFFSARLRGIRHQMEDFVLEFMNLTERNFT